MLISAIDDLAQNNNLVEGTACDYMVATANTLIEHGP
jgi:hypothetical protein